MKNEITRKQFLTLGVGAATVVLLPGCGDDGDTDTGADSGSDSGSGSTTNGTTNSTSNSTTVSTSDDTSSSGGSDPSSSSDPTDPSGDSESSSGGVDGSSSESGSTGTPAGCTADANTAWDDHDHPLVIPIADIMAGAMTMYTVGGGPHTHDVTLTPADIATLNATGEVVVNATVSETGHGHVVTITCV
ncbi:MAG: hypothetical protein IAG13_08935 [Deltaproteobacteria bacterium]|nr:hypothetical protein [Nannocystaceae bacterium]